MRAALRECKESLGSRELELEQAYTALSKADVARGNLRAAHEAELKEVGNESAAKATALLAEVRFRLILPHFRLKIASVENPADFLENTSDIIESDTV